MFFLVKCWQKDLFEQLLAKDYKTSDSFANMTEKDFDEIINAVRVARAEELKDQKAKERVEKLLSKFEKEYRKASGNKKTTIKKGMKAASGGKKDKTVTEEKNDEMSSGSGKELKTYMQKSNFWQKDLFDELLAANITGADELKELKVKEFDEIVRKVRVTRAQELKDAKSKNRLEKVLTAFEKEWQKQSGYKKTTIKKGSKAAAGGKKSAAPKDAKNEEMATKGAELKQWMRKESIWNKDLYDHLLAAGINGIDELSELDQKKMDDIIRKVRVDTVANLKDANARKRVDKLLTTFEKKWKATQK